MSPEGNSDGEYRMPTADVRAFAEVLSEITMSGSKVKGVNRPDVPGFVVQIIERGLSGDSRKANSFLEILETLKQNRFEIGAGAECDEIAKFVSWVELSEQSVQSTKSKTCRMAVLIRRFKVVKVA
jgi:hypothetical protein